MTEKTIRSLKELTAIRNDEDLRVMGLKMINGDFKEWEDLESFLEKRVGKAYYTRNACHELGEYRRNLQGRFNK